ncbi:MAG TPA: restriction endonuclease subunit S [Prolixibacteraceae bacterium]|nr:restriction endonuclease subunit S [Prolixibacteraceae bacterium]
MKTIAINKAFEFVRNGASIKQENGRTGIPISRIETIWDGNIDNERFGYADITEEKLKAFERYLLKEGDILMTHINSPKHLGKCAIYNNEPARLIHGMNLLCLRTNKEILYPKYAFYFFNSYRFKAIIPRISNQSVNQASFSAGNLKEIQIPFPPLPVQQKISAILDAADEYRQKTKDLIEKYDQLVQSLFLDMFGDIHSNLKRWEVIKLQSLFKNKSDLVDGPFGSSVNTRIDYIDNGEIPVIRTKNVSAKNEFIFDDLKFMTREKFETVKRSQVIPGDIILTKVGTIGNVCIFPDNYPEAVLSTTGSCRMRINESLINKFYFIYYLNFYKPKMLEIASAGVQAFLNMQHIKGFDVMLPTLSLQNQFAERIQLIDIQKQQAQASLQKADELFNSLLQQAFNGELIHEKQGLYM